MALNQALRIDDPQLMIAKYLIEKGAKLEQRSIIYVGLTGNAASLKWVLEQTKTPITPELENALTPDSLIKYTLEHLLPENAILIGLTNEGYHFTDGIGGIAAKLTDDNPNIFIVPLSDEIAAHDSLMIKFSGFINPGAGDSYPKNMSTFSFKDMDEAKIGGHERLYQRVISFSKKHDIPYLGICLGSQYLVLNSDGHLQPVKNHSGTISIHFEKGSIPHFMTLLPHEKAKALLECQLDDVFAENAVVIHGFAAAKDSLGTNIRLGAVSGLDETIPQSVSHGHNQIGVQFHPERAYFENSENKANRQKILLDNFFQNSINHQASRSYALQNGLDYTEARDSIHQTNQKLVNHLEACAKNKDYPRTEHFWGKDIGSHKIPTSRSIKDASLKILTGLTPKDIALSRNDDDLILIIKATGEMLSIESHFSENGDHRVKSIDFADGSRLILNNDCIVNHHLSSHLEDQAIFYRNSTIANSPSF